METCHSSACTLLPFWPPSWALGGPPTPSTFLGAAMCKETILVQKCPCRLTLLSGDFQLGGHSWPAGKRSWQLGAPPHDAHNGQLMVPVPTVVAAGAAACSGVGRRQPHCIPVPKPPTGPPNPPPASVRHRLLRASAPALPFWQTAWLSPAPSYKAGLRGHCTGPLERLGESVPLNAGGFGTCRHSPASVSHCPRDLPEASL